MKCNVCHKRTSSAQSTLCDTCFAHIQPAARMESDCFSAVEKIKEETELATHDDVFVTDLEEVHIVCGICLEEFNKEDFQQHQGSCSTHLVFECLTCREVYISREGLWNHLDHHKIAEELKESYIKETTVSQKHLSCVICNDQHGYPEELYWEHVHEDHDGNYLQCSVCRKHFRSKKLKTAHFINHCDSGGASDSKEETIQDETNSSFLTEKCPHCPERFHSVTRLYRHMYKVHKTRRTTEVNSLRNMECTVPYRCKICNGKYSSKASLRIHMKRTHGKHLNYNNFGNLANRCSETDRQIAMKVNADTKIEKFETVRKEDATRMSDIKMSSRQPNEGQCPHCSTTFKDGRKLVTHIDKSHVPTDCEVCNKSFSNYNQMVYHKVRQHTEPKYVCPYCPVKYYNMCDLRRHRIIHTQTDKIHCDLCGQWMKTQASMVLHLREKHPEKVEAKMENVPTTFQCLDCPRIFKEEHRFETHLYMSHKPASCDICGITFKGLYRRTYHNDKYHPEERHSCPLCALKFHKIEFNRHVARSHKGIKPVLQAHTNLMHPGGGDDLVHEESSGMVIDMNHDYIPVKNEVLEEEDEL